MAIAPQELGALMATACVGASLVVLAKAWAKKIENQSNTPRLPAESSERMERMERAIDAVAVEIERISENQRFLTRLLSERGEAASSGTLPRDGSPRGHTP